MATGHCGVRVAALLLFCFAFNSAAAAAATTFCLADGTQIAAERFETREGKFRLYVTGSANPLEYLPAQIRGININPCPVPERRELDRFGVHGSNTIGERLMPMLIDAFGRKRFSTPPVVKPLAPEEQELTLRAGAETRAVIDLNAHGSGTAAKDLIAGTATIGMASRRETPEEVQSLAARFNVDITAPGNEHVLALDGLAVIVNAGNSVKQLGLEQIAGIFSGEILDWGQVGGRPGPITIHARDDKSGTYDTFNNLVLKPLNKTLAPSAVRYESSENLSDTISQDTNSIGFIGLPYINKNTALLISSPCGLASGPTRFSVKTEEYPLARRLYLYTVGEPKEQTARDLIQFALSDEAQTTVHEAGFVDQAIELQDEGDQQQWSQRLMANPAASLGPDKRVPSEMVSAFQGTMPQVRRSSVVFRFEKSSDELDTRALQDVSRLARYLASQNNSKPFYIVGFADADGTWRKNLGLSVRRAARVGAALQRLGVPVSQNNILAVSYFAPVACNDSDAGKAKNRRVEIWIAR